MAHNNKILLFIIFLVSNKILATDPISVIDGSLISNKCVDILVGPLVVCASGNGDAVTKDLNDTVISRYEGHEREITAIAKNNTCSSFATGSADGTVRIWDTRTNRSTAILNFGRRVTQISWDNSGDYLAGYDYGSRELLWDLKTNRLLRTFDQRSPDNSSINAATITPDAKKVILGYMANEQMLSKVVIHDVHQQQAPYVLTIDNNGADIFQMTVNTNGRYLAVGDAGNNIHLVDMHRNNKVKKLQHSFRTTGMQETICAFDEDSRGSKYIAAAGFEDGEIGIWSLRSGEMHRTLKAPSRADAIVWSASGKYIATAHADGKNRIWAAK